MKILAECPATDAFLAEVRAQAHKEGAHFVANRMLAAWEAGFIEDTAKNAADIARMILTSTEFMDDAPEGDFRICSFADGVLEDIAAQIRKGTRNEQHRQTGFDQGISARIRKHHVYHSRSYGSSALHATALRQRAASESGQHARIPRGAERSEETLQREVCKIVDGHDRLQKKLKEAEAKLEAAEKRIAELEARGRVSR